MAMTHDEMLSKEYNSSSVADERAYQRDELIYNVTEDILVLLEDMNISKKELARRLGKSQSYVTQTLSGSRNMTLSSLSDICYALGKKVDVNITNSKEVNEEYFEPHRMTTFTIKECDISNASRDNFIIGYYYYSNLRNILQKDLIVENNVKEKKTLWHSIERTVSLNMAPDWRHDDINEMIDNVIHRPEARQWRREVA
ncbi:helix-turn-helix domain-containing protein [Aeromonas veronii]|uniref:helix-turn-helix domain-containing protein n=1 Tax=Aeromonas veronii TaxID=654 RepID=UPI000D7558CA